MVEPNRIPLIEVEGIEKSFYGIFANRGVHFELLPGEIHALLGENGAGKTTLMNILSGLYLPDAGTIKVRGKVQIFSSPKDAIASGIGMVHQHFMLVPVFTVWENMVLGLEKLEPVLPKKAIIERVAALSEQYGLSVDPQAHIWQLSVGEQQRVEILKNLYRGAEVLILDEPTSVLTPQETKELFRTLRKMASEGHGVVFISHKLDEVMEISDRITILRQGEVTRTIETRLATKEKLAEEMVGRKVSFHVAKKPISPKETLVQAQDLRVRNEMGMEAVCGVSLVLREHQILGMAGVAGNGQQELCEALAGLRPLESGKIVVCGEDLTGAHPRRFIEKGLSYIPADRKGVGLVPNMNLRENVALKKYWRPPVLKWKYFINWEFVAGLTGSLVERYGVSTPSLGSPVRILSGGNLQKLMLARELSDAPKVILAMHPTWGLDIGATQFVHERLLAERERGAAIFLVSEDLDELMALSDRLAVIYRGEIMGIVENPQSCRKEEIGLLMAGAKIGPKKEGAVE